MGAAIEGQSLAIAEFNAQGMAVRRVKAHARKWYNNHPGATVMTEKAVEDLERRRKIYYDRALKGEMKKMAKEPVKETVKDKGPEIQEIEIVPILLPILDTPDYSEYATGMLNLGYSIYNAGVRTRALILTNCYRVGFVKAFNMGMGRILSETCWNTPDHIKYTFKYVCLLSADLCHEQKGWLKRLVDVADSDETFGIVSPGKLCGTAPQKFGKPGMPQGYKDVRHITFDGGIIRRELLEQVGLLNELYYHYAADYELVHLAQEAGWKTIYVQDVFAEHDWNPDAIPEWVDHDRPLYYKRWSKKGLRIGHWGASK